MKRSEGRILTTHTGSLPRPDSLVKLLAARNRGEAVDAAAFSAEAEAATRQAIANQRQAGVDIGNNGEQGRVSFSTYVTTRMSGFGGSAQRNRHRDQKEFPGVIRPRVVDLMTTPQCVGPVHYQRLDAAAQECDEALRCLGEGGAFQETFMTAASPGIIALTMLNAYYPNYQAYLFAVAEEMRKEYELIVSKGFLLQLDCPDLAMERNVSYQDQPLSAFQELVKLNIQAINRAIRDIPPDRVRMHVCWGNTEAPHHYDVPLADILPLLYEARVGALVLEMANPRHAHEYKLFRQRPLPPGMLLVSGVIDTKTNYIEHPEVVADRLERAAQAVGDPSRVLAGTDCGFETAAGSGRVERGLVWEKLKAMRQGAEIASQNLRW